MFLIYIIDKSNELGKKQSLYKPSPKAKYLMRATVLIFDVIFFNFHCFYNILWLKNKRQFLKIVWFCSCFIYLFFFWGGVVPEVTLWMLSSSSGTDSNNGICTRLLVDIREYWIVKCLNRGYYRRDKNNRFGVIYF